MSSTDRQNRLLVTEDWKRIYQSYRNADFQSYDFDSLRRTLINYLRENYPEDFNDYIESSEYLALIDMIAFLGQNLSFRTDLNARENFLETAERRESVLRLARLISYNPKRNQAANGLLKFDSIKTTETLIDSSGTNLSGITINWNDASSSSWFEQFTQVLNAALPPDNGIGNPVKSDNVAGIPTEQYRLNALNTDIPRFKFSKTVEGSTVQFEVVSTDVQAGEILEEPPLPGNNPAFIFRDDGRGSGSSNTGFFMHFRQGALQTGDFSVSNPTPNQNIAIDVQNINNSDVWVYSIDSNGFESELWTKLDAVEGNNIIYNSLNKNIRNVYAVSTRVGDRVNLIFSDGVFGNLPAGGFRSYYRVSANRNITVSPAGMNNISIEIPYISRKNTNETLTITMSLKYTVTNAAQSESNASIKTNAPATYYTQNRMITAEDYNVAPLGVSQDIIKTKAVNRVSSGISRYLDLKDTTGKYSNTNLFGTDGVIYQQEFTERSDFTFVTQSDVEGIIYNKIQPLLKATNIKNFYWAKFPENIVTDLNASWTSVSTQTNADTGNLTDQDGVNLKVGQFTSNSLRLVESGTMLRFEPPEGYHFMLDSSNSIMEGNADHPNATTYKWVKVVTANGDGTGETNGIGDIILNDILPTSDNPNIKPILTQVKPKLATVLLDDLKTQIIDQTFAYNDYAIRYDDAARQWKLITADNINSTGAFSTGKAGDTSGQQLDASWLVYFKTNGETYTITYRNLRYVFESADEIKFYFDKSSKVFNPRTGKVLKDKIDVLSINTLPDGSGRPFTRDFTWSAVKEFRDSAGYRDTRKLEITFYDKDDDGVFDDPEMFEEIVNQEEYIFQKIYTTSDGVEDFKYFNNSNADIIKVTDESAVERTANNDGKIFYLTEEGIFKEFNSTANSLTTVSNYRAYIGRDGLKFNYLHVADSETRIDPSLSNIIDTFILSKNYDTQFRLYLANELASMPKPPSSDELYRQYGSKLNAIKSISDEIIYHPVKYKVLFGSKALPDLQVTFKVVKNPDLVLNDNDVKSRIIGYMNRFFSTENWDFGDTFFFQELSSYVMNSMSPDIVSFLIVPKQSDQSFGSLFQINSENNEIFINGATVKDIEIIDEITSTKLKASGKVVTSTIPTTVGVQSASVNTGATSSSSSSISSSSSSSSSNSGGYSY